MKTNEREEQILAILKEQRFASVRSLSELLYISPSSIRRDLTQMEARGLVRRNYGGVMLGGEERTAAPLTVRYEKNRAGKREIAARASVLLRDGMTVILDDSTTAYYLLEHLARYKNVSVFTNNLTTAAKAIELGLKTYTVGGVSANGTVVMTGSYAMEMLDRIYADVCFFSSFALSDDGEISDCTEEANEVRKKMLERSAVTVFLCDASKFHTHAAHLLCRVSDVDYVFSDTELPEGIGAKS